jgi:hypothetical protein
VQEANARDRKEDSRIANITSPHKFTPREPMAERCKRRTKERRVWPETILAPCPERPTRLDRRSTELGTEQGAVIKFSAALWFGQGDAVGASKGMHHFVERGD